MNGQATVTENLVHQVGLFLKAPSRVSDPLDFYDDEPEVDGSTLDLKSGNNIKTWTAKHDFNGAILGYCIQQYLKEKSTDHFLLSGKAYREIQTSDFKSQTVITEGSLIYVIEGQLVHYVSENNTQIIRSNAKLDTITKDINSYVKINNPIIGGHFHLEFSPLYGHQLIPKKTNPITFQDVILDPLVKEDISDNTIFHIQNVEMNNGIIFYGDPGTGKSLCCTAIVNEASKNKITSIVCITKPHFPMIEEIEELFLDKAIIIFEDIDSYSESRDEGPQPQLAEFLQFLNGVAGKAQRSIFIATTNHLERLDKAIKNRPIRFNRMYPFEYPKPSEIDQILDLLFKDAGCEKLYSLCHDQGFTGAHLADISRSCELLSKKNKKPINEVFTESVEKTKKTFGIKRKTLGFD